MNENFLKKMLMNGGEVSSKRGVMVWFVLNFTGYVWVNLFTGKTLEHSLASWLFQATMGSIVVVFGEPFINAIMTLRGVKQPPNIGLPDPPAQ